MTAAEQEHSQPGRDEIAGRDEIERQQTEAPQPVAAGEGMNAGEDAAASQRRILIGSQRDTMASRARPKRDWTPIDESGGEAVAASSATGSSTSPSSASASAPAAPTVASRADIPPEKKPAPVDDFILAGPPPGSPAAEALDAAEEAIRDTAAIVAASSSERSTRPSDRPAAALTGRERSTAEEYPSAQYPPQRSKAPLGPVVDATVPPSRRQRLTADMEAEFESALSGVSFDALMSENSGPSRREPLEPESTHRVKIIAARRDLVFVEFGGREQGTIPLAAFTTPPEVGSMIDVVVQRFDLEEGLYDISLPGSSVELGNWDDVRDGMIVDAMVTGFNTGGLECEVNHLRGFIPISQVALYRINDLTPYVGQKLPCMITEANRSRKNLVLSHRSVLERQKEENRQKFLEALQPGQVYEGTVRKLMDFGAFVELGNGADGLLHISQLSWGRVKHPSEILQEGQAVKVRVEKIDRATGRIGLSYRDMTENPWANAGAKYSPQTVVHGKVSKIMEFGAFVELEPGVEGLIHITELAHKRIWRVSDIVQEGQEIDVLVLSTDVEAQRIGLSLKAMTKQEPTKKEKEDEALAELPPSSTKNQRGNQPLQGGLTNKGDGAKFGLKW